MNKQQGAVTILTTAVILVISLLTLITAHKNSYGLLKSTQDQIRSRHVHWRVEGGLECAFSQVIEHGNTSTLVAQQDSLFASCEDKLKVNLSVSFDDEQNNYLLTSENNNVMGEKKFVARRFTESSAGGEGFGIIYAASNLYLKNSISANPPDAGIYDEVDNGWECILLKYKNKLKIYGTVVNRGLGQPTSLNNSADCKSNFLTVGSFNHQITEFKDDLSNDANISPFIDFFNVADSDHEMIRDKLFDAVIKQGPDYNLITDCGNAILAKMEDNKSKIWIEGNCEISVESYKEIERVSQDYQDAIILVHDGIFSILASNDQPELGFNGVIFHYNLDFSYNSDAWKGSKIPEQLLAPYTLPTFYFLGPAKVKGMVLLKSRQQTAEDGGWIYQDAIIDGSLELSYQQPVIDELDTNIQWVKGSWHDF